MKKPVLLLAWLSIPIAGAAGYFGARGNMSEHEKETAAGLRNPILATPAGVAFTTWRQRLEKCAAAELPAAWEEINALKDPAARRLVQRLLYARWAEVDAPGGVAFFTKVKEETKDSWGRIFILTEWALQDPVAAYEATMLLGKDSDGELTNVGSELLRESPEQFWVWFKKVRRPLPYQHDDAWQPVIAAHFDEIAAMAAEILAEPPAQPGVVYSTPRPAELYRMLAADLAARDLTKGIEWAKAAPESVRMIAMQGALRVMAETQPEKIGDYLSLLKDKQTGANMFSGGGAGALLKTAVETMSARDPLAALEWTASNQGKFGSNVYEGYRTVATALSEALRDGRLTPEQAFNAVRALKKDGGGGMSSNILRSMWSHLPVDQLASAAEWVKSVDSKDSRPLALGGILEAWERQDSAAAFAFAKQLNDPGVMNGLYVSIARGASNGLVSTQGERIATALARIPPERRADLVNEQVRMQYADHMADHSPAFEGARFAEILLDVPASAAKDRAVEMVAGTWGTTDPLSALEWAAKQGDPGLQEKASGAAIEAWAKEDAWGASEWIKEQTPGPARDSAAHHLARVLRTDEPESAWSWAAAIQDPATRLEAQSAVLRKWRDSSAADALAAVEALAANLTPEHQQRLVNTLEGRDSKK